MGWIYFQALVGSACLSEDESGPSLIVKTIDTARAFYCPECDEVSLAKLPYGTMCELSSQWCSRKKSISSTGGSPARTLALREMERAWKASEADFSLRSCDSLKKFDQLTSSLKTSQQSAHADLHASSLNSPLFGMTVDGQLSLPLKLELRTSGKDGSYLPTPCVKEGGYNQGGGSGRTGKKRPSLSTMASKNLWPTPHANCHTGPGLKKVGGLLNPTWVEWLMGYPTGHTDLKDSETL